MEFNFEWDPGRAGLNSVRREYDFSKAERGKFRRPDAKFNLPVYLDAEVRRFVENVAKKKRSDISTVVNRMLKSNMRRTKG